MSEELTLEQRRVKLVLERIIEAAVNDADEAAVYAERLDDMLDDLKMEDFFGTEAQCDPRGDNRDDNWSMYRVQGIDPGIDEL